MVSGSSQTPQRYGPGPRWRLSVEPDRCDRRPGSRSFSLHSRKNGRTDQRLPSTGDLLAVLACDDFAEAHTEARTAGSEGCREPSTRSICPDCGWSAAGSGRRQASGFGRSPLATRRRGTTRTPLVPLSPRFDHGTVKFVAGEPYPSGGSPCLARWMLAACCLAPFCSISFRAIAAFTRAHLRPIGVPRLASPFAVTSCSFLFSASSISRRRQSVFELSGLPGQAV